MHREGHIGAALLAYAPIGALVGIVSLELAFYGAVGVVGVAMLPDVDMQIPLVPHRGPTHTVWFALATGVAAGLLGLVVGWPRGVLVAVGLGVFGAVVGTVTVLAHIGADALTPAGVRPFAPLRDRRYTYGIASASNPVANYALLVLGLLATAGAAVVVGTVAG